MTLSMWDKILIRKKPEMAKIMGSDVTAKAISCQLDVRYRPLAKRQLAMLEADQDPKDVSIEDLSKKGKRGPGQALALSINSILQVFFPSNTTYSDHLLIILNIQRFKSASVAIRLSAL